MGEMSVKFSFHSNWDSWFICDWYFTAYCRAFLKFFLWIELQDRKCWLLADSSSDDLYIWRLEFSIHNIIYPWNQITLNYYFPQFAWTRENHNVMLVSSIRGKHSHHRSRKSSHIKSSIHKIVPPMKYVRIKLLFKIFMSFLSY